MVVALQQKLGMKVNVSEESQFIGALGAALFALDRAKARHVDVARTTGRSAR